MVEAVVAAGLGILAFTGLLTAYHLYTHAAFLNNRLTQAQLIAEEGLEISRLLRDQGWTGTISTYSSSSPYYAYWSGSTWLATSTVQPLIASRYHREILFAPAYRNSSDDLVAAGTFDPNTRKVTVTVSWREKSATSSTRLSSYIANIFND